MADALLFFIGGGLRTAAADAVKDMESCHVEKYSGSHSFGTIGTADR
jgi:hypothetical protein